MSVVRKENIYLFIVMMKVHTFSYKVKTWNLKLKILYTTHTFDNIKQILIDEM